MRRDGERLVFAMRVTPRAGANAIAGERDGALLVRVTAPPAGGAANAAASKLVARALGLPPTDVRIEAGHTARTKVVSVPAAAAARLARVVK